jgi:hypothetical protein
MDKIIAEIYEEAFSRASIIHHLLLAKRDGKWVIL